MRTIEVPANCHQCRFSEYCGGQIYECNLYMERYELNKKHKPDFCTARRVEVYETEEK